jgi:DNA-binding NtrC family response regulator
MAGAFRPVTGLTDGESEQLDRALGEEDQHGGDRKRYCRSPSPDRLVAADPITSAPPAPWVACVGSSAEARAAAVIDALRAQGVHARTAPSDGAGVILFDDFSPALSQLVHECSNGGLECVIAIHASGGQLPAEAFWELLNAGASDAFAWNSAHGPAAVAARLDRWRQVDDLSTLPAVRDTLIGESRAWRSMRRRIIEIARFTDAPVLITGESGTGKELVARAIHALDPRPRKRDLIVLDCTTIVSTLSGSEFFGHERGAFTGADSTRDGAFALADGGTLFLDEMGELPLPLQAELLRVTQEGTYKRVGGNVWRSTSFRLVCATNKDLLAETAQERFRRDLYYRIAAWRVDLPRLSDRQEDILPLTRHFLRQLRPGPDQCQIDEPVLAFLARRDYPGNIRDLRHLVTCMSHRHVGPGPITLGDIPEEERGQRADPDWRGGSFEQSIRMALLLGVGLRDITNAAADTAIKVALSDESGNLQRASRRLGVTARALQLRRAGSRAAAG